ncbi:WYL domain-containing protein [Shewanella sp.]|uniref:WYL domain-containing protein n=1 Tax=Shewanella sp. TaxID=50422 RepID=UPI001ECAD7F7|nr:WYL domain-containing protein [Shewanella sp.]NRB23698.1 WYL domain-containing protein [Shewanella sp.]
MATNNLQQRKLFIELVAWWEGTVTNKQLTEQFAISRQQAYQDFKRYNEQFPDNLIQTSHGFKPSKTFIAHYMSSDINQYLQWFDTKQIHEHSPITANVSHLALPTRRVSVDVIRVLVKAIRQRKRMETNYISLSNPESDGRIFHPHTFVNTGLRWHVRGYCEKSQQYRDLVLSRFRGVADIVDGPYQDASLDRDWQTYIPLILQPDPRLSPAKKAVLAHDYQMEGGQLIINTRAALASYLLRELQVNTKMLDGTPEAQQLILVNQDDIKKWLLNH